MACHTVAVIRAYVVTCISMLLLASGATASHQAQAEYPYLEAPPRPSLWTLNEEWVYCHHRASCGTRADPGLQITPEDTAQWNDGIQCFCEGYYKMDSTTHNGKCYRGTCDAGVERRTLRGRSQDSVRQLSREGVLEPIGDADARGLCKFRQLFDNQVDVRLCTNHLAGDAAVDINYGGYTDPPPKNYGAADGAAPLIIGLPLSPQGQVDEKFFKVMQSVAGEDKLPPRETAGPPTTAAKKR